MNPEAPKIEEKLIFLIQQLSLILDKLGELCDELKKRPKKQSDKNPPNI